MGTPDFLRRIAWRVFAAAVTLGAGLTGCDRTPAETAGHGGAGAAAGAPTNRIDIPDSVRRNLGITFARVEPRNVARTLRVPGRFELLPTARREYRAAVSGRVELLVAQYQRVEAGTALYRVDSAAWRDLHERIAATTARVDSMGPLREAHRVHERSLADKATLWQDRLKQLEELREAGGGSAAQFTDARATLNSAQAELADVMEKDAELQATEKQLEAELRSLTARHDLLVKAGNCADPHAGHDPGAGYTVCAVAPGVVATLAITQGGLAEENGEVLSVVQPEMLRFRARGLQSDLGRLRDGLRAEIAPPQGGTVDATATMAGELRIGLSADAEDRTVDLIVRPESISAWARAGVSAQLEITLDGGSEDLAIPMSAVARDGTQAIIFRRDPANPDKVIRLEADLGVSDGRWVVISSGVKEGDEVVVGGNYQLMLASSGSAPKGGHFHPDGTFHEGEH